MPSTGSLPGRERSGNRADGADAGRTRERTRRGAPERQEPPATRSIRISSLHDSAPFVQNDQREP